MLSLGSQTFCQEDLALQDEAAETQQPMLGGTRGQRIGQNAFFDARNRPRRHSTLERLNNINLPAVSIKKTNP